LECFASKQWSRRAPGILVAVLLAAAALLLFLPGSLWLSLGLAGLAVLLLVVWPMHFPVARERIGRLLQPKFVWAALLAVSLLSARFLGANVLSSLETPEAPHEVDLADVPVHATEALTDKDRSIALFHFKFYSTAAQVERFIAGSEKEQRQIIRLLEANPASNCHGWIFTGGQYGVRDSDVAKILADNNYVEVTEPRDGDLAVYTVHDQICHSGLVRIANKHAPVLIESKWGPLGVYLHAVKSQPFGEVCKFYRSPREGHLVTLRRSAIAPVSVASPIN
jgi:hypothetical protein